MASPSVPQLGPGVRLEVNLGPEEFTEEVVEAAEALREALAAMPGVTAARFAFDGRTGHHRGKSKSRPFLRADVWVRAWWERSAGPESALELVESAS